ncbi:MAG: hypothetical protein HW409_1491 [candidate division NC10 bacterium]|nr:hypothetical protein [candidate division NC10 bacterium]
MQSIRRKPGSEKGSVIHEDICHPRGGERRYDRWIPHPLGKPQAPRTDAETGPEALAHQIDLGHAVLVRDRREDRLV